MNQSWSKFDINNIILPTIYSKKVQDAIEKDELGNPANRLAFIRESVAYFETRLPWPTSDEYSAISKKFCDHYPVFKNAHHTKYWVSVSLIWVSVCHLLL